MTSYPKLRHMLADILGVDEDALSPRTRLARQGGVDAISRAKLALRAERAFKIALRDEDLADLPRLSDLAAYIDAQCEDGQAKDQPPSDADRQAWYYE